MYLFYDVASMELCLRNSKGVEIKELAGEYNIIGRSRGMEERTKFPQDLFPTFPMESPGTSRGLF
jgi:hypothetical protein